jgi:hypothetical protein|uniref:Uncharacterized protein n=1 Tax=Siphoviridae sp. ctyNQ5 TaxID=2825745 RepID=A0A8S5QCD4_9CAUD|nr:MAG TPA: hypothetical protein [Siphoviridae sp. ctyNQ5]
MRLINADKLKEAIEEEKDDNDYMCRLCLESIKEIIDEQPTAFDVEKVTDEILRASCIARPMGWDRKREIIETHTAIEIVKGGGVDD